MINSTELSQDYVKSILRYKDGKLFWKKRHFINCRKVGSKAGSVCDDGVKITIDYRTYRLHRIIFLMHHGYIPDCIDHIDNNPLNNRIENLRPASQSQNLANMRIPPRNTSGFKGVASQGENGRWRALIIFNRKKISLGGFGSKIDAAIAYDLKAIELYGNFARLNFPKKSRAIAERLRKENIC